MTSRSSPWKLDASPQRICRCSRTAITVRHNSSVQTAAASPSLTAPMRKTFTACHAGHHQCNDGFRLAEIRLGFAISRSLHTIGNHSRLYRRASGLTQRNNLIVVGQMVAVANDVRHTAEMLPQQKRLVAHGDDIVQRIIQTKQMSIRDNALNVSVDEAVNRIACSPWE